MSKTGYISARVEPKLKASAGKVLRKVGVSTSDAITMFLRQVVMQGGLPFEVRVPNAETQKAIDELEAGGGEVRHGSTKEIFDEALRDRKKRKA
ncbi:addiction module antitoxin RelB [Candidatus Kaiserbacteria bacterium RIFCSPHIGHO2_01_FULL_56_24]|uniref:Addiction module antitoxin RelB n=1 Tax=Candidatus Kaiserbacteria bacterium RIFCSPHIGHO2_01_FULL_56_24 TaxID=1798487 RepID=A0A1F6DBQ5_9BACT|nr:MAG: addiction module antitoxin RelB [Candidatus Kaiserbacteria bacterium RIFCSPHIGHO2_01_FULL_56_24]